jgi:NitT/TauT family transport system substrate-binding protein
VARHLSRLGLTALAAALVLCASTAWSAQARVSVNIPSKSLAIMPFYFGKDKGFFAGEGIDLQLVLMAPPIAITALVSGELDFVITLGAGAPAIMQGHPLKRIMYVQQDLTFALTAQPEIKSIRELKGKIIAVNAPNDATGMSVKEILKGNGVDPSSVTFLGTQTMENAVLALTSKRVQATVLAPPFAEQAEVNGYNRLAEARDYAPLSTIGLMATVKSMQSNTTTGLAMIRALLRTLGYLQSPANRDEVIQYISVFHKLDRAIAGKAFSSMLAAYSKDGTKPHAAVQKEINVYRENLKIAKSFTPNDLEDLSYLRRVQESLATGTGR